MLFLARNYELIKDREKTFLTDNSAVGATTLTVKAVNTDAWANGDYLIVGHIGTKNAEVSAIGAAVSNGTSITTSALVYAHSSGEPVYRIDYNQVQFLRGTTIVGSAASQLALAAIQPDDEFTRYEDVTNTTGYGFVRFKNSTTATYSAYSDSVPYTGYTPKSLGRMLKMVRRRLDNPPIDKIQDEDITEELNEKQRDIAHERLWPFYESIFSASTVEYQRDYDISSSCVVGKSHTVTVDSEPLAKIDASRYDILKWDSNTTGEPTRFLVWNNKIKLYPLPTSSATSTTLDGGITATATSITLTSVSGFREPGRCIIDSEVISYEATDSTNNYLLGCQRGLEGTTAATHSTAATVTERDIVYTAHEEPTELVDISDETKVPDPDVLVNGAAMELAIGKLQDQVLHDRLKDKYEKGLDGLRDKFGKKATFAFFRIKDKDEVVRDDGLVTDPNLYPKNFS